MGDNTRPQSTPSRPPYGGGEVRLFPSHPSPFRFKLNDDGACQPNLHSPQQAECVVAHLLFARALPELCLF